MVGDFIESHSEPEDPDPSIVGEYTFTARQEVRFAEHGRHCLVGEKTKPGQITRVESVEDIPDRCSCRLGSKVPRFLHPERCLLRVRREAMHHQFVYANVDGSLRRFSGYYFEPA
jgi:hypothetical protein